ncbi:MAG: methyltransferase domain-containing protein [Thermosynechococcaceae cyanobacterium MS004]|nr:methyltransferase domain-containing protein [Thermosynechococcaceae cyanobacterium MS004]
MNEINSTLKPVSRKFNWLSSVSGDSIILSELNQSMSWFYGSHDGRKTYQEMLEANNNNINDNSDINWLPQYICSLQPNSILEVGCSSGRMYRHLINHGYLKNYCGIEVAEHIINKNKILYPQAKWECSSAYEIPYKNESFDIVFSTYVLEHLIYPEKSLHEMMRVLQPGGYLILVFPDFVSVGRLPSQQMGFSPIESAFKKLRLGKIIDAIISLYDSRIRLPYALKTASQRLGPFPVNLSPICLTYPDIMDADIDAIYIASKDEIHNWASINGYSVTYPKGKEGFFRLHACMSIQK